MKRRVLSIILATAMLLTTVDISAFAKQPDEERISAFFEIDDFQPSEELSEPTVSPTESENDEKDDGEYEAPEETVTPDISETPEKTEVPEMPEETPSLESTYTPEAPDKTKEPEATESPMPVETPTPVDNAEETPTVFPGESASASVSATASAVVPMASPGATPSATPVKTPEIMEPLVLSSGPVNCNKFIAPVDKPDASAVKIKTAEELNKIREDLYGSYVLMNDIDLSGYDDWNPIGSSSAAFSGKFDGQGHTITGLTVKENITAGTLLSPSYAVGLFGVCNGAQIKNVAIENADVSIINTSGYGYASNINGDYSIYAGIIAGYITNSSVVYNCCTSGTVLAKAEEEAGSAAFAGGLIGSADTVIVSYCSNAAGVQGYNGNATTAFNAYVGGIAGRFSTEGTVDRTYNNGTIYGVTLDWGNAYAGGLVGSSLNSSLQITDCCNQGAVQGQAGNLFCDAAYAGGIAAEFSGSIKNVYNSGSVNAKTGGYVGGTAYAGGICGVSSENAGIIDSAIVQSTVAASGESGSYQYHISNGGSKRNTISTVTSGATNDADIIKSVEEMKTEEPYANLLGWDFEKIWAMIEGEDFPQLRIVDTGSEEYQDEYIIQHLEYVDSPLYADLLDNYRWAQIYWSEENNFTSNLGEKLYDGVDTIVSWVTLDFAEIFDDDNPFKVILADYLEDQTVKKEVVHLQEATVPHSLDKIYKKGESFIRANWKDAYGELSDEDLFWLFHYKEKPSEVWINTDFEKHIKEIVCDDKRSEGFESVLGITTEIFDTILEQKDNLNDTIGWINDVIDYSAQVDAYVSADEEFKEVLERMCENLPETTEIERRYKKQLAAAIISYTRYNDKDNIVSQMFASYIADEINDDVRDFIADTVQKQVKNWMKAVFSATALAAIEKIQKAVGTTWKIMEYVTKNGKLQECRETLRANAYFEDAMYFTLRSIENDLKANQTIENARLFDAAYKFFKETEIYSMDVCMTYMDTYQTAWLPAIRNLSNTFMNSAIEEVHINKLFLYNSYCHGESYTLGGKVIMIACPTNVFVYDESGNLMVSIENDNVTECAERFSASSINNVKVITVPLDQNYTIRIDATDSGRMSYSISEYGSDYRNIQTTIYPDAPINQGVSYTGQISNEVGGESDSYNLIGSDSEIIDDYTNSTNPSNVPVSSLTLQAEKETLSIGESIFLSKEILPVDATVQTVIWTTSDSGVASVSEDGEVTGISDGKVLITATALYGGAQGTVLLSVVADKESGDILPEDMPPDGIIPDGIWTSAIPDKTYTGGSLTQSFRLYDGSRMLKEKTDYTLSYKNNKAAYTYTQEDYAAFEQNLADTGKRVKTGSFDPAKAPQIIIKMKGNYSGSQIIYFQIHPEDITGETFTVSDLSATYTGKKQTPTPVLTWNGKALKYGTDFYIPEYDNAKNDKSAFKEPGTYTLTVTGKKNFTGEIPVTFTISAGVKQIAMDKVTVKGIKNQPWTGEQVTQSGFTLSYKKDILAEGSGMEGKGGAGTGNAGESGNETGDYTVTYGENISVGTGTITFTGTGVDADGDGYSYIGTKTMTFKITGTAMSKVTVSGVEKSYTYIGEDIQPAAILTYKANKNAEPVTLTEGTHYTVTYQKNRDKGTASIIFTGLAGGGYTGTKKQTFKIVSSGIADKKEGETTIEQISVAFKETGNIQDGIYVAPYMKGGAKPEVLVTSGKTVLTTGKDYTVSYANNKKVALSTDKKAPTVTVKGKGNYAGTKQVTFTIAAKALTNENGIRVVAKDKTASTKKNGYRQTFKVYDADGKALGSGDYDTKNVSYTLIQMENADGTVTERNDALDKNSIVPAGAVIQITVQGKGAYEGGTATGTYRILEGGHDISKAVIQIKNQSYTGRPVRITGQEQFKEGKVYIKIGKTSRVLTLGEDIEVVPDSYVKNINKGTAKVTFCGINEFGGTKTVSYKIGVRSIGDFWKGIVDKVTGLFAGTEAPMALPERKIWLT